MVQLRVQLKIGNFCLNDFFCGCNIFEISVINIFQIAYKVFCLDWESNGMLRHSLATLEGEQDFIFLYRALLS